MWKKALAVAAMIFSVAAMAAVDVNKASETELDGVKGLGPSTTKLLLKERQTSPFKGWDDLIGRVKGIGPSRAARLSSEGLTVGGEPYKAMAASHGKAEKEKPKK